MFNWIREYFELREEFKSCKSCETLKMQLAIANLEKEKLLNRLLEKPTEIIPIREDEPKVIRPHVPWNVRKQMVESEDREKARLMRLAPQPNLKSDVDSLEQELLNAESNRAKEASKS